MAPVEVVNALYARFAQRVPAGDRVLALGGYRVVDAHDREVVATFAHVYQVEHGLIARFDQSTDTAVLAAAREDG